MKQFYDLIKSYESSGMDSACVSDWYAAISPSDEMLSAIANHIGAEFLASHIGFNVANGLLNQLMPLVGFEAAPKGFWDYYIAFEDSETSNDPDTHARTAVTTLKAAGAA
jgi:hypothetical protein